MKDDQMDRTINEAAAEYNRPPEAPREEMWQAIKTAEDGLGRLETAGAVVLPFRRRAFRVAVPVGIAALLALAFGLGRVSVDDPAPGSAPIVADAPAQPSAPLAGTPDDSVAPAELEIGAPTELATTAPAAEAGESSQPSPAVPSRPDPSGSTQPSPAVPSRPEPSGSSALALAAREHLAQAESFLVLFRASINAGQQVEPVVPATARYLLASNRLLIDSPAAEEPGMRRLLSDVELVLAQIAQMPGGAADSTDERFITDGIEQRDLLLRIRSAAGNSRGMLNHGVL